MATIGIPPTSYIGILDRYTKIEGANGEPNPFELVKGTWGLNPRIHLINRKTGVEVFYEKMSISIMIPKIKRMLYERFDAIDFAQARQDVEPFIRDRSSLDLWRTDFFKQITERLRGQ